MKREYEIKGARHASLKACYVMKSPGLKIIYKNTIIHSTSLWKIIVHQEWATLRMHACYRTWNSAILTNMLLNSSGFSFKYYNIIIWTWLENKQI